GELRTERVTRRVPFEAVFANALRRRHEANLPQAVGYFPLPAARPSPAATRAEVRRFTQALRFPRLRTASAAVHRAITTDPALVPAAAARGASTDARGRSRSARSRGEWPRVCLAPVPRPRHLEPKEACRETGQDRNARRAPRVPHP